jgi:hypothetical protein
MQRIHPRGAIAVAKKHVGQDWLFVTAYPLTEIDFDIFQND